MYWLNQPINFYSDIHLLTAIATNEFINPNHKHYSSLALFLAFYSHSLSRTLLLTYNHVALISVRCKGSIFQN